MKQILFIIAFFFVCLSENFAQEIPIIIRADGKVMNRGRYLGTLTMAGGLDQNGKIVSSLNESGNTVDSAGKMLGNTSEGSVLTYYCDGKPQHYFISKASNNYLIKNKKGKTYILMDRQYKAQAISALHYIYENACVL